MSFISDLRSNPSRKKTRPEYQRITKTAEDGIKQKNRCKCANKQNNSERDKESSTVQFSNKGY